MSERIIRVTARPRAGGMDIDRLARALLEFAAQLPDHQAKSVAAKPDIKISKYVRKANSSKREGVA